MYFFVCFQGIHLLEQLIKSLAYLFQFPGSTLCTCREKIDCQNAEHLASAHCLSLVNTYFNM